MMKIQKGVRLTLTNAFRIFFETTTCFLAVHCLLNTHILLDSGGFLRHHFNTVRYLILNGVIPAFWKVCLLPNHGLKLNSIWICGDCQIYWLLNRAMLQQMCNILGHFLIWFWRLLLDLTLTGRYCIYDLFSCHVNFLFANSTWMNQNWLALFCGTLNCGFTWGFFFATTPYDDGFW